MKVIYKLEGFPTGVMVVPYCPNCNEPTHDEPNCPFCNTKLEYGNDIDLKNEIERLQDRINKAIEYIEDKLIDIDTHNVYGEIERLDLEEIKRILNEGNI